jgi:hypothetical protein
MASEWQELSLAEAGVQRIDCDHRTPPAADRGALGWMGLEVPLMADDALTQSDADTLLRMEKVSASADTVLDPRACSG